MVSSVAIKLGSIGSSPVPALSKWSTKVLATKASLPLKPSPLISWVIPVTVTVKSPLGILAVFGSRVKTSV